MNALDLVQKLLEDIKMIQSRERTDRLVHQEAGSIADVDGAWVYWNIPTQEVRVVMTGHSRKVHVNKAVACSVRAIRRVMKKEGVSVDGCYLPRTEPLEGAKVVFRR